MFCHVLISLLSATADVPWSDSREQLADIIIMVVLKKYCGISMKIMIIQNASTGLTALLYYLW